MVLRAARKRNGWTQGEVASRLGVSQGYLSLLEQGKRQPPSRLAQQLAELYALSPTTLPVPATLAADSSVSMDTVAEALATLGYPGFGHFKPGRPENPAVVVLRALESDRLESRLASALPWVLRTYPDLNWDWLIREAKPFGSGGCFWSRVRYGGRKAVATVPSPRGSQALECAQQLDCGRTPRLKACCPILGAAF